MKATSEFQGEQLYPSPEIAQLKYDRFGELLVNRVNSLLKGTPAEIQVPEENQPVAYSSTFRLFALDEAARQEGVRAAYPHELEALLHQNRLPEQGSVYYDEGVVLDFSRRDHDLALRLYNQLPSELKDLDKLPALAVALRTVRSDRGAYGLALDYAEHSRLTPAKILLRGIGRFSKDDPELVKTGLPSKLGEGTRTLFAPTQHNTSLENLGLSGLNLDGDLGLGSYWRGLAGSDEWGRVALVRDAVAQKN